eukprot:jgi/Undpi1/7696/HiC_scaffold_23.g10169.m1
MWVFFVIRGIAVHPVSRISKRRSGTLADDSSPPGPAIMAETDQNPCTCKKCKCLKLYCDCFAGSRFCGTACLCKDCHNRSDQEVLRAARRSTLERNPDAFTRALVLVKDPDSVLDGAGCGCTKSQCLKKYCVCFQRAVRCGSACKCEGCMNTVGNRGHQDAAANSTPQPASKLVSLRNEVAGLGVGAIAAAAAAAGGAAGNPFALPSSSSSSPDPGTVLAGSSGRDGRWPSEGVSHGVGGGGAEARKAGLGARVGVSAAGTAAAGAGKKKKDSGGGRKKRAQCKASGQAVPKRRKMLLSSPDADEPPLANCFGPFSSGLKKGCGLLSLSFLDNDDIYNACLVSRGWSQLAMDPALWEAATAT